MHFNGYHENDTVRITRALVGEDPYTDKPVPLPSGETGTVVVGSPGRSEYIVEFVLPTNDDSYYSVVATVNLEDLEPYTENATV